MRRLLTLVILVALVGVAWHYRGALRGAWVELRGGGAAPSPELAETARSKIARLTGRDAPERVALSSAEVQSLVEFRIADLLPSYVVSPRIELVDGRVRLRAQVPTALFPRVEELSEVVGFLPDTTDVSITGQLIPLDGGRVGLAVDEVTAARIPLPRGLIPSMLRRLGRRDEPGLPADAMALPLPEGATAAYIRGDSLVFVARAGEE